MRGLYFFPEDIHSSPMGNQESLSYNPRFSHAITNGVLAPVTRSPGSMLAGVVPKHRATPRLIERDPAFHLVAKCFEDDTRIVCIIRYKLFLIERAAVSFQKLVRKIPVVQCDDWLDSGGVKVVDELGVKF